MSVNLETNDHCNHTSTQNQKDVILIIMASVGLLSFSICGLAMGLVFYLRLHKHFVYRLALYQVISSMLISVNDMISLSLSSYILKHNENFHHGMCLLTGVLLTYFIWLKLIFTMTLTMHLFLLAICLKDFKRFEIHSIVFSALFPLSFVWVPFVTNDYGPAGGWCWIKDRNSDGSHSKDGEIEQYTIYYGPSYLGLLFTIIAAGAVILVLCWRGCCQQCNSSSSEIEPLLAQKHIKHRKALIEIIPLLAYPAIFFLFNAFAMVHRIFNALQKCPNYDLALTHSLVNALWGTLSSFALLLHILITRCLKKETKRQFLKNPAPTTQHRTGEGLTTNYTTCTEITHATTSHIIPTESEIDKIMEET